MDCLLFLAGALTALGVCYLVLVIKYGQHSDLVNGCACFAAAALAIFVAVFLV